MIDRFVDPHRNHKTLNTLKTTDIYGGVSVRQSPRHGTMVKHDGLKNYLTFAALIASGSGQQS
jgi:hypothetical protein